MIDLLDYESRIKIVQYRILRAYVTLKGAECLASNAM